MHRERTLSVLGYDPELLRELPAAQRHSLRGAGVAWLFACLMLGLAAAYAAHLVHSAIWAALVGGTCVTLLTLNLLRVVTAGGGCELSGDLRATEAACRRYRPSLVPAAVFVVLAAILAQPAQLPFWPGLDHEVEVHRQALIEQHNTTATSAGSAADHSRHPLEAAGFPVFRLKLIWQNPARAARFTIILCVLVLLPAFWSQVISIRSVRAYEWQRCRRTHPAIFALDAETRAHTAALLGKWRSFEPRAAKERSALDQRRTSLGPWLRRSSQ